MRGPFFVSTEAGDLMLAMPFPAVMGILNVTPDSFSDGGRYLQHDRAIEHARQMIVEGADIIDIGGESTRPGAEPVSLGEELDRTIPVIEALRRESDIPISIDTSSGGVMLEAAAAGANLINDVRALHREGALEAAASTGLPVCLMHMQGEPGNMQDDPRYDDLVGEVLIFFQERMEQCERAGISTERLLLDPGFGFGKTPAQNLELIHRLPEFAAVGRPVLVGLSRKSTIGMIVTGEDRLYGSVAGAVVAVQQGAAIVRVHDVRPTVDALRVLRAIEQQVLPQKN